MLNTTLIYIERDGKYLMLHRTKKENDLNHDKWIGVGGKCEEDESPEECARREAFEETGLTLGELRYHGIVTFVSDEYEGEYMHLFTCTDWEAHFILFCLFSRKCSQILERNTADHRPSGFCPGLRQIPYWRGPIG